MSKIKENLDQQAISVDERQKLQVETIQALRLREKMLQKCQALIDKGAEVPETELQRAFERYVTIYKRPNVPRRKSQFTYTGIRAGGYRRLRRRLH